MMKKFLMAYLLLSVSLFANADPSLVGRWKSDSALSMKFNREHAVMQEKTALFLEQLMGHMIITFTADTITTDMPDVDTKSAAGVVSHLHGFHESHPFEFLGSAPSQVAIRTVEPVTSLHRIEVFNFEDENTVWIYAGGGAFPSMNFREYFVREH